MVAEDKNQEKIDQDELVLLQRYASATSTEIITSSTDVYNQDRPSRNMMAWCKQQKKVLVLSSCIILTCEPGTRLVQNCKSIMITKGMLPGKVFAATQALLGILFAGSEAYGLEDTERNTSFSDQQQHLRELINDAVTRGVSDIHIEVRQKRTKIRMRQHGSLDLFAEWSEKMGREMAAVAFNKETDHATAHFNPMIPQDASMPLLIHGKSIRLRLASVPAHGGFDMVMRILATGDEEVPTLQALGYTEKQVEVIAHATQLPHGAILVAGPTGSGKTTTLASCMEMIDVRQKIYSIEDPVEKVVEKATQVPVNTDKDDRSFASFGKAALRMDPDNIVLGEMRDEETASVMVRAAITGHLVFSTIHTNSAPGIVTRLVDMGVSPVLLSDVSVLRCLICQRLVPTLCLHCRIPLSESSAHAQALVRWEEVFDSDLATFYAQGVGCDKCKQTKLSGRSVIAEVIWIDERGREFIKNCQINDWIKYLKSNGWKDYREQAMSLVSKGVVDPFDAEHVIGPLSRSTEAEVFDYREPVVKKGS